MYKYLKLEFRVKLLYDNNVQLICPCACVHLFIKHFDLKIATNA